METFELSPALGAPHDGILLDGSPFALAFCDQEDALGRPTPIPCSEEGFALARQAAAIERAGHGRSAGPRLFLCPLRRLERSGDHGAWGIEAPGPRVEQEDGSGRSAAPGSWAECRAWLLRRERRMRWLAAARLESLASP